MDKEKQEFQRYGRNKSTSINHTYINSGEYRNKFNKISSNPKLNRYIYQVAKTMLLHRTGTLFEDMYWINIDTVELIAKETAQKIEEQIIYSKSTKKLLHKAKSKNILTIHTRPNSMPPSVSDFNSCLKNNYAISLVCCHDGKIFMYNSNRHLIDFFYKMTVAKYLKSGYNNYEAQINAIQEYVLKGDILFKSS